MHWGFLLPLFPLAVSVCLAQAPPLRGDTVVTGTYDPLSLEEMDRSVTVHMPGGKIGIEIGPDFSILMTGTVNKVAEGTMHPELFLVKV